MINRIFFFLTLSPPPPMKREAAFSVVVYDHNYQYLHQVAFRFMGGGNAVKFNCFWYKLATVGDDFYK